MSYIPPDGPIPCDVAVVGEAPAREELREGRGLVGPSGRITWDLFRVGTGLERSQVYVSNLSKTPREGDGWTSEETAKLQAELLAELAAVRPRRVYAVGAWAARALAPDFSLGDMHSLHGVWMRGHELWMRGAGAYRVLPVWHPAAALRGDGDALLKTAWDFARPIDGPLWERRELSYFLADGPHDWLDYSTVALDTEGSVAHPWGLSWAVRTEGHIIAGVIREQDKAGIARLQDALQRGGSRVLLHHALRDLPALRALGLDVVRRTLGDTMALAYHKQVEPQALKDLALRHLGVVSPSFEQLVKPVWEQRVREMAQEKLESEGYVLLRSPKTRRILKRPRIVRTERGKMLGRRLGNPKLLAELLADVPAMDLNLLPPERAVRYSAEDAVMTLILGERLT